MGAQGWIATVLGIVMAVAGALVAAPAFDAAVRAGASEQWTRARKWFAFRILGRRSVSIGIPAGDAWTVEGEAYGYSPASWPADASTQERLELLRQYASETRRKVIVEAKARVAGDRRLEAELKRQGREQAQRLDSVVIQLEQRERRQTKRQLAAVPFVAVGVLLTAAGSAVGLLPLAWFVAVLVLALLVPFALARLVWIAPSGP